MERGFKTGCDARATKPRDPEFRGSERITTHADSGDGRTMHLEGVDTTATMPSTIVKPERAKKGALPSPSDKPNHTQSR
jgi:hypothetical protein